MELIKKITRAGNSSNVLLPKEWLGGTARIQLIEKPINIKKDILEILSPYLEEVMGIYLTGSYARKEETDESDIDILVITTNMDKRIKEGKYDITMISKENLEKSIQENIMPLLPMIKESKSIMNGDLIKEYKKIMPNKRNLKWIFEVVKSSKKVNEMAISLSEEMGESVSDGIAYSLVLNLRSIYTITCLKNNKIPTTKGLKSLIVRLAGTEEPYKAYIRSKMSLPEKKTLSPEVAKKINSSLKISQNERERQKENSKDHK